MPQGYLVTLGDGYLDSGDAISGSQTNFTTASTIGAGSWTWSGVYQNNGQSYNNVTDTGIYYEATDGNVYFVPDNYYITSGTATATSAPYYTNLPTDGTVDGTAGDDEIDYHYKDSGSTDQVDGGDNAGTDQDVIDAGAGNDSVDAGDADDTVYGGTGTDTITGGRGSDSIDGGEGDDVIYGDVDTTNGGGIDTGLKWDQQGVADETSIAGGITTTSVSGDIDVTVTVTQEENFNDASMETTDGLYDFDSRSDSSSLELYGGTGTGTGAGGPGQNASTVTFDFSSNNAANFSDEVTNVSFGIFDIDELQGQFIDQVIITAFDANGNPVAVTLTPGDPNTISVNNATGTATSIVNSGGSGAIDSQSGFLQVDIAGPVSQIVIDYNNVDTAYGNHAIRIGDLEFTQVPVAEFSNANDVISGGDGADEIYGGEGDDTIQGNADGDTVYGGTGDDSLSGDTGSDTLYGGEGADNISGGDGFDTLYGGTGNDSLFGWGDDDTLFGGDGDDYVDGDEGADSLSGGDGADTIVGDGGNDSIDGGTGADSIYAGADNDTVYGGTGDDTAYLGDGNDTFGDWSTDDGNDTVYGGAGNDFINGGNDNDELYGGADDDTLIGASGDDTLYGGTGNDVFQITDDHESDTIIGGEDAGDGDIDSVSFNNWTSTDGVTVTATGDEAGNYDYDGTNGTGTFVEIEEIQTTNYDDTVDMSADGSGVNVSTFDGDDSIIGGDGDDLVFGGEGADTFNTGEGNDSVDLGSDGAGNPDGDADVIVLQDDFGDDVVTNFDAPTPNGNGTFTGIDTLDVSALFDLPAGDPNRTPVLTNDVTVTDDGFGNAVLTFPNGESITLDGISPTDADNPFYLNAIGIPMPDGTVEGTSGADTINNGYTGDPDGDMVDAGDAILPGDVNNDDLIYGYGGDDVISAGAGDDEIYGGTDNDDIYSGSGDDLVYAGSGDDVIAASIGSDEIYGGAGDDTMSAGGFAGAGDTLDGGTGNDTITGGQGDDTMFGGSGDDTFNVSSQGGTDTIEGGEDVGDGDVDTLNFTDASGPDGITVTMTGDEDGNYTFPSETGNGTFTEIEQFNLTDQDDTFDGVLATGGNTVDGGAGDDVLTGSSGEDSFIGGTGNDTINSNAGDDSIDAGDGDDTVYADEGADSISGGSGSDELYGGDGEDTIDGGDDDDTIFGGSGNDTLTGGEGADTITGGADEDLIYGGAGDVIDGSESGTDNDTLVVSGVDYIDYDTNPENGIVYFEGGGSLTFSNIENVVVSDRDGTVSGTAGNDTIDASYVGDPDGDQVDDTDAILTGHEPNDDLIEAHAGDDLIISGAGDDTIYAGADNDTVLAGTGDDTIFGEEGNDLISGEAGSDIAYGGTGDDIINGGTEADSLYGGDDQDTFVLDEGFGSDVIEGGEGGSDNDEVWSTQDVDVTVTATGDEAGTITDGTSSATFSEIETIHTEGGDDTINLAGDSAGMTVDSGAGQDIITGGAGGDSIDAGADDDTVFGGSGSDTIELGAGDDQATLGAGDDTAYGGAGSDVFQIDDDDGTNVVVGGEIDDASGDILSASTSTPVNVTTSGDEAGTMTTGTTTVTFSEIEEIHTNDGNDTVDLSNDTSGMEVLTFDGNDSVTGGSGDDYVLAGDGDDTLDGNEGSDTLYGGAGDDEITFSEGDTATGGSGDDLFVLEDLGETSNGTITIDGGSGDETPDPDGDGPLTGGDTLQIGNLGTLTQAVRDTFVDDGSGSYSGSITLDDGTILNFSEIENIICFTPNTRIATPKGLVAIEDLEVGDMVVTRDHGLQPIRWIEGRTVPAVDRFAPIKIRKNVLAGQDRDLIVSPQHRVLFQGYRAELLFGESEVLVAAKHLVDGMDVTQDEAAMVTYVHMLFDQHEVIYAEGAATESFHPGDIGFSAVGDAAREELFAIFPELRVDPRQYGSTARRCLKMHEAKLIRT